MLFKGFKILTDKSTTDRHLAVVIDPTGKRKRSAFVRDTKRAAINAATASVNKGKGSRPGGKL